MAYMSCPRQCGVDVREHNSSDLIDGGCDTNSPDDAADLTDLADLLLDVGGYLGCGCHGSQREHTCGPLD